MDDQYKTIETPSTGYFKDKGSKFYSYAYPLKDEEEVKDFKSRISVYNISDYFSDPFFKTKKIIHCRL